MYTVFSVAYTMSELALTVHLKTKTALQKTVTIVIYATYSADLVIAGDTVVTPNF